MREIEMLLGVAGIVVILLFVALIVLYVCNALGVSYVLQSLGFEHSWFAWIPVLNYIALSYAVCRDEDGNTELFGFKLPGVVFSLWILLCFLIKKVPVVGGILSIVVKALFYGKTLQTVYAKFEKCGESEVAAIAYVSALIEIVAIVKLMSYRKNAVK